MKKRIIKKEDLEKEWFVGNNLNDKIYVGPLNEVKAKLEKDEVIKKDSLGLGGGSFLHHHQRKKNEKKLRST